MDSTAPDSFRRDVRVIGLIGVAHSLSHFFQLALPPLFPLLRAEFDVSWTLLGLLVGVFYGASGLTQFAAGFAVDRVGARPVLLCGLGLLAGGTVVASLVPGVYWLFPVVALMGVGNGVFHPADFAVLNASIAPKRLGYAYSMHGVGGNLGYAAAPIVSFALASAFNWRVALATMGVIGLVALAVLASQRAFLDVAPRGGRAHAHAVRQLPDVHAARDRAVLLLLRRADDRVGRPADVPAVGAQRRLRRAARPRHVGGHRLPAGQHRRASWRAAFSRRAPAVTTSSRRRGSWPARRCSWSSRSASVPIPAIVPLFALVGFALGSTGPSRDLIVRNATPKGAAGRVYGFVYSGLDLGAMLGPVWFGLMLDHGLARQMFLVVAVLLVVAVGTVFRVRRALVAA